MSPHKHHGDLSGHRLTIEVMYGSKEMPLSAVSLCRMDVTPSLALGMCRSPHQTILYLLKIEQGGRLKV